MKSSKVKGNIINTWHRRSITAWHLCEPVLPHKDIKASSGRLWQPEEEDFNRAFDGGIDVILALQEERYYYLEDWLASRCTGYFLMITDTKSRAYDIYFENEKDLTFFNLSW